MPAIALMATPRSGGIEEIERAQCGKSHGQIADVDEVPHSGDARGGDYVFQFADITGPGMLQEHSLRAPR